MDDDRDVRREAYVTFMQEFIGESDRASVILASAEIEVRLQRLFEKVLITNAQLRKDLFDFRGPLGGFSARLKMARALGLIDKQFYEVLEAFRSIRNAIVHEGTGVSLEDASLIPLTERILKPFRASSSFPTWADEHDHLTPSQVEFRYALAFMMLMLEDATQEGTMVEMRTQTCDPDFYLK